MVIDVVFQALLAFGQTVFLGFLGGFQGFVVVRQIFSHASPGFSIGVLLVIALHCRVECLWFLHCLEALRDDVFYQALKAPRGFVVGFL